MKWRYPLKCYPLRRRLGTSAAGAWAQPTFNITLLAQRPAAPGVTNTITLHDVKLDSWVYNLPEDDFVLEAVTFQALYLTVEDKAA